MASRSMKIWRCSIYFYVIFFGVTGLFLGCLTSYVLIRNFGLREFYDPVQCSIYFMYAPALLILVSAGIGWRAVKRKNVIFLKCFSVSQAVIIGLIISGSIWNFVSLQMLHDTALPVFQTKFNELAQGHGNEIWDSIQRKLKCCGIHGAFDYKTLNVVPFSCCSQATATQYPAFCISMHHVGCLDAFTGNSSENFAILATVGAIISLFQIPGVFASWCFANKIRKERSLALRKNASNKLLLSKNKQSKAEGPFIQETAA